MLLKDVSNVWQHYTVRGNHNKRPCPNHINIDRANTLEHELTKALLGVMIAKGIPSNIYEDIAEEWVTFLQSAIPTLKANVLDDKGRVIYTEAERKSDKQVIDLVDLIDEEEIEIMYQNKDVETREKYEKEGRKYIILPTL